MSGPGAVDNVEGGGPQSAELSSAEPGPVEPRSADPRPGAREVIAAASQRGLTIAACESLTAGLLAASLADVPGASAVLRGGLVTYATELKHTLAGVDADLLAQRGAVDPDVALSMARGAAQVCGAELGISCTGVAGPDPQDGKPVGRVYIGLWQTGGAGRPGDSGADAEGCGHVQRYDFSGSRAQIRSQVVDAGLDLLARALG